VALRLASESAVVRDEHQLLAPTLIRSQVLSMLFRAVQGGKMRKKEADRCLDYVRGLHIRLLGDRSLQDTAWKIAERLGWPDTLAAEYVALTQLQADALVTLDARLANAVKGIVRVAPYKALLRA
jgi:predicted nucleic acid-binding protein